MGADYLPYRVRQGDVAELGKPYKFGAELSLLEMPISWSLDDYPPFRVLSHATSGAARPAIGPHCDGQLDR
jgi:hypothetical protein